MNKLLNKNMFLIIAILYKFLIYFVLARENNSQELLNNNENSEEIYLNNSQEFINNDSDEFYQSLDYLEKYGFLEKTENDMELLNINFTNKKYLNALKSFQEYYNLNITNILDNETLVLMNTPRCGVTDYYKNYVDKPTTWKQPIITWDIIQTNKNLTEIANKAFQIWESHANITFMHTPYKNLQNKPNIIISFGKTVHKSYTFDQRCTTNFDGPGNVLGHAFSPHPELTSVDIHIDKSENWNYKLSHTEIDNNKMSFFTVLVHEIGHALGLAHINNKNSIMYAYNRNIYFNNILNFKLSSEDIFAIQNLYGKKLENTNISQHGLPKQDQNEKIIPPYNFPDLCSLNKLSKFVVMDNKLLIFYNKWVWIKNIFENGFDPQPLYLPSWLTFIPKNFKNLSAVYRRPNGNLVLVIDDIFYNIVWPNMKLDSHKIILPTAIKNIQGIVHTNMGNTFIFYNNMYVIKFNECNLEIDFYGYINTIFPGIPLEIEGVVQYINGYIYFLKNNVVYEYSEYLKLVIKATQFDLSIFEINCPNISILKQLKNLLSKLQNKYSSY